MSLNPLILEYMIHLLTIVGARPLLIKAAALSRRISKEFSLGTLLVTPEIAEFMEKFQDTDLLVGQIMLGNGIFILYQQQSDLPKLDGLVKEEVCFKTVKKI